MRAVAYMPLSIAPPLFATLISTRKWRLRASTSGATAATRPSNTCAGLRLHGDARERAGLQAAGFELGDAGFELERAQVGDGHDRIAAGSHQTAGVEVARHDDARHGRPKRGVPLHLARAPEGGIGLLHVGRGQIALRLGSAPLHFGGFEPLLGNRALLVQAAGPFHFLPGVLERGVRGIDAGAHDRDGRHGRIHLRVNLAAIERGQRLPFSDRGAKLHQHLVERARELGPDVHARFRREVARQLDRGFQRAVVRAHHGNGRECRCFSVAVAPDTRSLAQPDVPAALWPWQSSPQESRTLSNYASVFST